MDEKKKEEALKPFNETVTEADLYIEELREKLGDDATKVNDTLIGLKGTILKATELHETTVVENLTTKERNEKLAQVNNDLYIKNSDALKRNQKPESNVQDMDDDEALDNFVSSVTGGK